LDEDSDKDNSDDEDMLEEEKNYDGPDRTGTTFDKYKPKKEGGKKRKGKKVIESTFETNFLDVWKEEIRSKDNQKENDPDYHFCMALLGNMKQMNERNKSIVKIRIDQLLHDALFSGIQNPEKLAPLSQYHNRLDGSVASAAIMAKEAANTPLKPASNCTISAYNTSTPLSGQGDGDVTSINSPTVSYMYEFEHSDIVNL
jgi:hypothetical protein